MFCIILLSDAVNNFASGFLDVFSSFSSSLDFSFSNMSYTILKDKENSKIGDIKDVVTLDDTSMAFECDAKVAKITLGNKMLPSHLKYAYLEKDEKNPCYDICLAYS